MSLRRGSFANVTSVLALIVALSGAGYAAATITGSDVVDGSLTGRDLMDGSVRGRDIVRGAIRSPEVRDLAVTDLRIGAMPGAAAGAMYGGTMPAGNSEMLDLETELFDTRRMYDPGEDLIRVPLHGTYVVTAAVNTDGATSQRQVRIVVNGDPVMVAREGDDAAIAPLSVTAVLRLHAGDQVSIGSFSTSPVEITDFSTVPDLPGAYLAVQMITR